MADAPIRANKLPAAGSALEAGYTVPGGVTIAVVHVIVTNHGAATTFRLTRDLLGAGAGDEERLAWDAPIGANGVAEFTVGLTALATDVFRVGSASGAVSFNFSGIETS